MLSDVEIAWLAGLLEGEGCFRVANSPKRLASGRRPVLVVGLKMTDEDVVERAVKLWPVAGRITIEENNHKPRWAKTYKATWHGQRAEDLMVLVLPYMGQRRSAKIKECLAHPSLSHTDSVPIETE